MKKRLGLALVAMALIALFAVPAMAVDVATSADLASAIATGGAIKLAANITVNTSYDITHDTTLDLAGYTLNTSTTQAYDPVFTVNKGATLTINDSVGNGKFVGFQAAIKVFGNQTPGGSAINSKLILNAGTIESKWWTVSVIGKGAQFDMNGGVAKVSEVDGYAVNGNGIDNGGTIININGGEVIGGTGVDPVNTNIAAAGIYHPQSGTINVKGGTISGYMGIQLKAGTLNVSGGTITANGAMPSPIASYDGATRIGAAIALITCNGYKGGDMNVTISGNPVIKTTGTGSYAIFEKIVEKDKTTETPPTANSAASKLKSLSISGGTFTGVTGVFSLENKGNAFTPAITGGIYSSDPSAYVAEGYKAAQLADKTWAVFSKNAKIAVTPAAMALKVGETGTVKVASDVVQEAVTYKSSAEGVATVSDGTVKAIKAGIAVITATGNTSGAQAGCTVTVTDPATPDPVPTPAPVTPTVVTSADNPVVKDTGVPAEVKAADPVLITATTESVTAIAKSVDVAEDFFAATADGKITVSPVVAKAAVAAVISDDADVQPETITTLPVITTTVEKEKVAALAMKITGTDLGATANTVVSDIYLIKILKDKTGDEFDYVSDPAAYADKTFTLKDADGKNLVSTDKVVPGSTYSLIVFVKDNGDFDYDKTAGSVIDPLAVATNKAATPTPTSGGSSGGCNAGMFGFALVLLAAPLYARKKK